MSDPADLRAELARQQRARADACLAAIEQALREHNCAIVAVPAFATDGIGGWRVTTRIDVVPR